ncbi:TetR/AcrR family transcriptional regulator [Nocardia sp. CA-151230]|uniref:TetR/AcrR family transcriptional regulator n=1 Tax=Nocardia sp. CA-151230 TaxID=3239982 RepID=UPI003D9177B0
MSRWEPNARGRLEAAALELFREHGFDSTTVTEIAARAGLTERTFFRHFTDKREVLFGGSQLLRDLLIAKVGAAPADVTPWAAVVCALEEIADEVFEPRRPLVLQRQVVVDANPELRERELIKSATLAAAIADALRNRGAADTAAELAGQAGIAVLHTAFGRWTRQHGNRELSRFIRETADEMQTLTARANPAGRR